jgi:hypothetical protein
VAGRTVRARGVASPPWQALNAACDRHKGTPLLRAGETREQPWLEQLSWHPRAWLYHGFLSREECEYLIEQARQKKNPIQTARCESLKSTMSLPSPPTVVYIVAAAAEDTSTAQGGGGGEERLNRSSWNMACQQGDATVGHAPNQLIQRRLHAVKPLVDVKLTIKGLMKRIHERQMNSHQLTVVHQQRATRVATPSSAGVRHVT